ncbi:MAG: hypothetical protein DI539_06135 [Flavobacterium psychrophilum]|nr:MAG: hypothetical protein DI539_06135 [Flavobacterium psychrophilum]
MFKAIISATKAMLSVVALVLAFTLNASAQDRSAYAAQKMTDNMKTELTLTDAQYTKVLDINKDFVAKSADARKASTDRAVTAKSVQGLNEEREKQLKTVLTEEQYKNYLLKKDEKKKMVRQRFDGQEKPTIAQPANLPKKQ